MEQSKDNNPASQQNDHPNPVIPVESPVPQNIGDDSQAHHGGEGGGNESGGGRNWLAGLWNEGPDRQLELIFACVIALSSLAQIGIAVWNDISTSRQVDKIITAAGGIQDSARQIKDAAWQFKGSAQWMAGSASQFTTSAGQINTGVSNAVKKLQAQAAAAQQAADIAKKSIQTSLDIFHQEQRPWIGIKDAICNGCEAKVVRDYSPYPGLTIKLLSTDNLQIDFENSGHTPAVDVVSRYFIRDDYADEVLPTFDQVSTNLNETQALFEQPTALAPGAAQMIKALENQPGLAADITLGHKRQAIDIIGKITYRSTWADEEHVTTFCLINLRGDTEARFSFCPSGGNDMK